MEALMEYKGFTIDYTIENEKAFYRWNGYESNKITDIWDRIDSAYIYTYTRANALEDGMLHDVNKFIPVEESGYKYPIACTAAVMAIVEKAVDNKRYLQDYPGIFWDILHMSRYAIVKKTADTIWFNVIIKGAARKSIYVLKMMVHGGDSGEPVMTIMLPDED
jgi:hypothetical protein